MKTGTNGNRKRQNGLFFSRACAQNIRFPLFGSPKEKTAGTAWAGLNAPALLVA